MTPTMAKNDLPFKHGTSQCSFWDRLRHFLDMVDPMTLFTTKKELNDAIELLDKVERREPLLGVTDQQLWKAQKIKQAIIHSDTGEKIFMPCRMSGFVPFRSFAVIALLVPNQTFGQMVFWHWINQSHNACVNYCNRNARKPTDAMKFIIGYVGAITSACSIAVGLSVLLKRSHAFRPATKIIMQRFVPYPAVAIDFMLFIKIIRDITMSATNGILAIAFASVSNLYLMRWNELSEGIEVTDSKNHPVGTSFIAAKKAVSETAVTRAFLPAPALMIPPMIITLLERTSLLRRFPILNLLIQSIACVVCFGITLPISLAMFPQIAQIETTKLEEGIQSNTDETVLFYNKGL